MVISVFFSGSFLVAGAGQAEVQRVEAMGSYGILDSARNQVNPRDEAIALATWEGVSRVALELIGASGPGAADAELRRIKAALGEDMLPYTRSYRILRDKGEKPVLFGDRPGVSTEYVVVMEVLVDVDRLGDALEGAGLVSGSDAGLTVGSTGPAGAVTVELVGLTDYAALSVVLDVLREKLGATRVRTLEFAQSRQVLSVEGPFTAAGLLTRMERYRNPQLILEPMGVDAAGERIRLMGRWSPAGPPGSLGGSTLQSP